MQMNEMTRTKSKYDIVTHSVCVVEGYKWRTVSFPTVPLQRGASPTAHNIKEGDLPLPPFVPDHVSTGFFDFRIFYAPNRNFYERSRCKVFFRIMTSVTACTNNGYENFYVFHNCRVIG